MSLKNTSKFDNELPSPVLPLYPTTHKSKQFLSMFFICDTKQLIYYMYHGEKSPICHKIQGELEAVFELNAKKSHGV